MIDMNELLAMAIGLDHALDEIIAEAIHFNFEGIIGIENLVLK